MLAQTYPNRRFLLAGTAFGLISTDTSSITEDPPNGTIFDRLNAHGISWKSYASNVSTLFIIASVPRNNPANITTMRRFFADAAAGTLPAVSFVDSNIFTGDEENPQDIQLGEAFVSSVVQRRHERAGVVQDHARLDLRRARRLLRSRATTARRSHPTTFRREITVPPDQPGGYDRYGFRVPTVVVSPYGRPDFVSHTVYDHTSILKTIERKWNLPAMTFRDANANDLFDCLDLTGRPAFLEPPTLAAPANPTGVSHCPATAPTAPPPGAFVTSVPSTT